MDVARAAKDIMTFRPAELQQALSRARKITDPALRSAVDRVLAAAARGDALSMVEILSALEPHREPSLELSNELFGEVPAEGFLAEDLPREEELGSPEVLESPEEFLRPLDTEPSFEDLGLELASFDDD
jgi:hypothetical protein